jgi:hypothetical protein
MPGTPLVKKLLIKPGMRMLIMNAPVGYRPQLGDLHAEPEAAPAEAGAFDWVQLFVRNLAELEQAGPVALATIKPSGLLWVSFPKKSSRIASDIGRDSSWEGMASRGWQGVSLIAIDETWSAMRFKPLK